MRLVLPSSSDYPGVAPCCAQMAAYAVGKPPPPPLHWQHRRGESVKLVALLAAVLLVGGSVVASVRPDSV